MEEEIIDAMEEKREDKGLVDCSENEEVRWKLYIFQSQGIQTVLALLWDLVQQNESVLKDSYLELNLALQKALVSDFNVETMLESAVQDWNEDSPHGHPLSKEDFALFLFELTALWCGKNVTLNAYVLFLGTVYIWVSKKIQIK